MLLNSAVLSVNRILHRRLTCRKNKGKQRSSGMTWFICPKLLQICPTLWDPLDCSPPSSSVHGISQARILEWVAKPSSRVSSWPRDWPHVSYISCNGPCGPYHKGHLESGVKPQPLRQPHCIHTISPWWPLRSPYRILRSPRSRV